MTLFRRITPWLVCGTLLVQGCAHQPPPQVRYGLKTYPVSSKPEEFRRPAKDRAPLVKLNPDEIIDAVPAPVTLARYGNHTPYNVLGKRYYLLPTAKGYAESGIGSWYGEKFQGQPTSTMEPYDLYAMTAAHKSLPLPTYVRVTNLENNRSAIVKVNDRGPFVDDRVIDLSYAAAVKLGYAEKGTARVKVEAITFGDVPMITRGETRHSLNKAPVSALAARPASALKPAVQAKNDKNEFLLANSEPTAAGSITAAPAPTASTLTSTNTVSSAVASNGPLQIAMSDKQIFLQAGAFSDQQAAHNLQSRLTQVVSAPVKVAKNDNTHFRVHVGPFSDESTARQALAQIRDSQLANPLLIRR